MSGWRVLIANRGEIAVRLARGIRAVGDVPLGVYSDADARAPHVAAMDDAIRIGPARAAESYLNIERILAAAKALGAEAIHPGYGFLSERAEFARAVEAAGLVFIGPSAAAIAAVGDKSAAKAVARACGVPVIAGYDGEDLSPERLRAEAAAIGTPLLVKASAGGGGRGMRVVDALDDLDEAVASARREAMAAFGDDRVLLERYLTRPRHIEFQIVADAFGATIHLGERECSIQRRHQKIVEEAPSPAVDAALRAKMGEAAVAIARAVGYRGAGTAEFLLDADGSFYFLEMNARLQVEHPVTEIVIGLDLVALQLAIAKGAPLPIAQTDIEPRGAAIEVRINAEDPRTGLPATGRLTRVEFPPRPSLRYDIGIAVGSDVTIDYDSMLGKVIASGSDRSNAIANLTEALARTRLDGVVTNLPLLRAIARDDAFRSGDLATNFLVERAGALARDSDDERGHDADARLLAFATLLSGDMAWRALGARVPLAIDDEFGRRHQVLATRSSAAPGAWTLADVTDDAPPLTITITRRGDRLTVVARDRRIVGTSERAGDEIIIYGDDTPFVFTIAPPPSLEGRATNTSTTGGSIVVAPMPGKILRVAVKVGDRVATRDVLVVLEAMKMEHRIEATRPGTVGSIAAVEGALVAGGATLVELT